MSQATSHWVDIDGAMGEGGGQVLRSSLTLSLLTGRPVRIFNIRARRPKPGLRPQHLKAVEAAAMVGGAEVEGARLGASTLLFQPGQVRPGDYHLDIGTAGATSLVLQTVFLPLALAAGESSLTLEGGTHVPWSPCYHYLAWQWLPWMARLGLQAELSMDRPGFYPEGGGRVRARIHGGGRLQGLTLLDRGALREVEGLSAVCELDLSIARRQQRRALARLEGLGCPLRVEVERWRGRSRGTVLLLLARFEHSQFCAFSLGARGKPAERVADEAAQALLDFLETPGVFDEHLADQLLLPLALAPEPSTLLTPRLTRHLLTNAEVIRAFLPVRIEVEGQEGEPGRVAVEPHP